GTSGCESAKRPPGGPQSNGTSGQKGCTGRERVNQSKEKTKSTNYCAAPIGTFGPRGREGREPLGSADARNFRSGQLGQRDARDAESRESRKPMKVCHVSSPQEGQGSLNRVDRRSLSQTVWDSRAVRTRGTQKSGRPTDES
ncbi:hypothetical protein KI387_003702, partial [Taxus chinensis]